MRQHLNFVRLLSVLLSLVLLIGLMPLAAMTASATSLSFGYAYDCQRNPSYPIQGQNVHTYSFELPLLSYKNRTGSYHSGSWMLTSRGFYTGNYSDYSGATSNLNGVINKVAVGYGNLSPEVIEVYELTENGSHIAYGALIAQGSGTALFIGDTWEYENGGAGYLLSTDEITGSSKDFTVNLDVKSNLHTHNWVADTSSPGLKEATATIKCDTCHETLTVSLKASDVTLPGNVFTAQIEKTPGAAPARTAQVATNPLKVSQTPGYQYSPNGSGFTPVNDPNSFTPKQGIYQASILVSDGANLNEDLFVKYTVSDPVVTAATGDNRPIELMAAGLVAFSVMAAAAFVLDSKRRTIR